jgi:hypothetical protein
MTDQSKKHRPFGVTLLAIFAYIAGFVAIFHTLQMLHLLPFLKIGEKAFFGFSFFGAIMWIILALIYFWVGKLLWDLNEQGWLFVVVLAVLNLIMAFVMVLGKTTFTAVLPAVLINGLVLIYAMLPGVKNSFTPMPTPQKAAAPPAPAAPKAEAPAAPAAPAAPVEEAPAAPEENTEA